MGRSYYVDAAVTQSGDGSSEKPFKRIQEAADIALPGDEVVVKTGIYREYVNPKNAGTDEERITYRSEKPLEAVITGAEPVTDWERYEGDVWTVRVK